MCSPPEVGLNEAMGGSVRDDLDRAHRVPPCDDSWRIFGSDLPARRPRRRHRGPRVLQLLRDS